MSAIGNANGWFVLFVFVFVMRFGATVLLLRYTAMRLRCNNKKMTDLVFPPTEGTMLHRVGHHFLLHLIS